ncbi:hypothetical protein GRQ40_11345 [Anoxybacillus sp. PDR2]|uniref:hypothetical protein n=1 Tax=Anoxybacillus sp. PDR2 TaxID=1636720 RepID=UPI001315F841|nr:hypothetical protein [Anoxybacillus sp. PDR2]QHC04482.1 hypothetical protein GRQ40_11345 [Anoxybacillus sp. PDR2]
MVEMKPLNINWSLKHMSASFMGRGGEDGIRELFWQYEPCLAKIERTTMTKSYKMVVLQAMLDRGPVH